MELFELVLVAMAFLIAYFIILILCIRYTNKTLGGRVKHLRNEHDELRKLFEKLAKQNLREKNEIKQMISEIKEEVLHNPKESKEKLLVAKARAR